VRMVDEAKRVYGVSAHGIDAEGVISQYRKGVVVLVGF